MREGNRRPVAKLVDEYVIAHHERGDHRAAGNLEGLDDKCAKGKRDGYSHENRFDVFAHLALAPSTQPDIDCAVGTLERVDESRLVERHSVHGFAQAFEVLPQLVAFPRPKSAPAALLLRGYV